LAVSSLGSLACVVTFVTSFLLVLYEYNKIVRKASQWGISHKRKVFGDFRRSQLDILGTVL